MSGEKKTRTEAYRISTTVALVLALLTVIEFFAASANSLILMMLLAVFKAVAVLYWFMHVPRLWTTNEEH